VTDRNRENHYCLDRQATAAVEGMKQRYDQQNLQQAACNKRGAAADPIRQRAGKRKSLSVQA